MKGSTIWTVVAIVVAVYLTHSIDKNQYSRMASPVADQMRSTNQLRHVNEIPNVKFTLSSGLCHSRDDIAYAMTKYYLSFDTLHGCEEAQRVSRDGGNVLLWYVQKYGKRKAFAHIKNGKQLEGMVAQ